MLILYAVIQIKNVLHVHSGFTTIFEYSQITDQKAFPVISSLSTLCGHIITTGLERTESLIPHRPEKHGLTPEKILHMEVRVWYRCVSNNMLMLISHGHLTPMTKHKTHDKSL